MNIESLLLWSRAQFALTAMYHWLFVPLTLGLGVIMAIAETCYYKSGKESWKISAKFWQKLFGINFAIGVATGIILEFEFGTNWSNYSWFVGDIFGAPLAIEGILAFFMESTFIAVMFFGWNKVSKGFHLASTWLTIIGATISAVWILVANGWMQFPSGTVFNPDTVRVEMSSFLDVALSPVAVIKFLHTVTSSWLLGSAFAFGICAIYLLRKGKNLHDFARMNMKMIAPFGLVAAILAGLTGDESAVQIGKHQPMKLAAMEALYDGGICNKEGKYNAGQGAPLTGFGIVKSREDIIKNGEPTTSLSIKIPYMLSILATHTPNGYVPGIKNILEGDYYTRDGKKAVPVDTMIARGKIAISAMKDYRQAAKNKDEAAKAIAKKQLDDNFEYFGYGYFQNKTDLVPPIAINFYAFRIMVGLGTLFVLQFIIGLFFAKKKTIENKKWFLWFCIIMMPMAWIASEAGWVVAELGRQPWAIQGLLPLQAAVSNLATSNVIITFFLFLLVFTTLLIAEINIMRKAIVEGPNVENK